MTATSSYLNLPVRDEAEVRAIRERSDERLYDAQGVADELLAIAAQLEKRAPWQGNAKDAHEELAGHIREAVSDFLNCKAYCDIRHELDQAEQSKEDAARGAERRALIDSQI